MTNSTRFAQKALLLATATPLVLAFATPAFAQDLQPTPVPAPTGAQGDTKAASTEDPTAQDQGGDIVVTGTLFKSREATPSPVTTVSTDELDRRGISTIQDGLQALASNNGPALTNNFTANGAFASGASAISLRGLSTNSTLVLFDGLRAAYYPLADDGTRNFVDLNNIPDDIVDRVEVLRDGASASYGADAIAGVVNIITKRQVKGVMGRAESGVSQYGDGQQYRLSLTAGVGDLDEQGYNAYISGYYIKQEGIRASARAFPFNTADYRALGGPNGVINGVTPAGTFALSTGGNFEVRPATLTNATTPVAVAGTRYQNLNSDCGIGTPYTLTDAQFAAAATAPRTVCQFDRRNLYGNITSPIDRFGLSARVTAKVTDSIEAYGEFNFTQSNTFFTARAPATFRGAAPTGINYPQFDTSTNSALRAPGSFNLYLPVFVCAARVNCATAADRRFNPNNPFAAAGNVALLIGTDNSFGTIPTNSTRSRSYRAAFGVSGDITDRIAFDVSGTLMHIDLRQTYTGYVYIQHLLDVINDGTYNFINPSATTAAVRNYLTPTKINNDTSDQYQLQGSLRGRLVDLPGGPLELAVGLSERYEAVDSPSANDDFNGPTQRYFTLNAFGTKGHRFIFSAFGELNAPIVTALTVNLSGRYDKYSSGQDAFSPKAGIVFKPFRQLTLRGTYSRGFRIPSFGESNALPTTGYVNNNAALFTDAYLAQYGCTKATYSTACPAYINATSSYGQTTLASPNLKPEKSRSFTAGILVEPIRNVSFTVDYYNIKKTGAIASPDLAAAAAAYYAGAAIPAGINVVPDSPDPNNPLAKPRVAFVQAPYINADSIRSEGIDFAVNADFNITSGVKLNTSLEASYILLLSTTVNGVEQRFDGTLGPQSPTAGSGTPKWRGNWLATVDFGGFTISNTVNYVSGYDKSATDAGTLYMDCGLNTSYTTCHTKSYLTDDIQLAYRVTDKFTFYVNVNNIANRLPPFDPAASYGITGFNLVQAGNGFNGRYFKAGAKFGF
ncbi:TonB-dependent receptor plug domain-containing protein [uncultured Sphingomonas sp.]|uniref:TonB-dependent receptor plug domain-containing protein n=1 Tax=uncultured Sphingomonas sp. TaxID=158754 RepID=UPI0035CC6C5B